MNNISIREKQAIGAMCIEAFSKYYNIEYKGLGELIDHLLSILVVDSLIDWETQGKLLNVTGRGDDFPEELNDIIPENIFKDFYNLVDNAVEIGIIDMYGALTDEPDECLSVCFRILEAHNIKLNIPELLLDFNYVDKSWGVPWGNNDYEKLKSKDKQ